MKFDNNLAKIHAYLCGDGYVIKNPENQKHKYYVIGFRNTNLALLMDFQNCFYKYFKIKPKIYKNERSALHSKELYFLLTKEFGSFYSREWKAPKLSKKHLRSWLRAFYDSEGWVEIQKAKSRVIGLQSINENGIKSVQKNLSKFKINSSLKYKENRKIWTLRISGLDDIKKFSKFIGFSHPNKSLKLKEAISSYINYYWNIPKDKKDLLNFIKLKGKIRDNGNQLKIHSIKLKNLLILKKLLKSYNVESKIHGPWKNQYDSINYYLVLNNVK